MKEYEHLLNEVLKNERDSKVEFELTAKMKDKKPASQYQIFKDIIDEYNTIHSSTKTFDYEIWENNDLFKAEKESREINEILCTVKFAADLYLSVMINDSSEERIILLPDKDGTRFTIGEMLYIYTEQYKGHNILLGDYAESEYNNNSKLFADLTIEEKLSLINKMKDDPEGFSLWGKLGKVKRVLNNNISPSSNIKNRTKEFLIRIPEDRDDLYRSLKRTYDRYNYASRSETMDYEEALSAKMQMISMMLSFRNSTAEHLTLEYLKDHLEGVKIFACDNLKNRPDEWFPNILIIGRDYHKVMDQLADLNLSYNEISLQGVEGNDYLFGNPMCYYHTGQGELVSVLSENDLSTVLFTDVDLMGTTIRSCNPIYGIAGLLRKHTFTDFYMQDLVIEVKNIHFMCQANNLEDFPKQLMSEIDIVLEIE